MCLGRIEKLIKQLKSISNILYSIVIILSIQRGIKNKPITMENKLLQIEFGHLNLRFALRKHIIFNNLNLQ